ncbi:hypothetical protein BDB00DRAFT_878767 [Zychaea mexicana]|uniref:uncharacterized protein n=1 Tax=Zychaea mexicana TaxID=64656 RepID=UPI0022FEC67C|nr:uncharacterized protein BDB00DRAFT_878767 [Zychaea mexicana]KAI9484512.1 hypothetical protein BDB00DRAFT_878767 [Zychaea mexicana]
MYVTYDSSQFTIEFTDRSPRGPHRRPPKRVPSSIPTPPFKPTYLVRISDMKRVLATNVNEGYCALSYSWNWSGDIIKHEKNDDEEPEYSREDHGQHTMIYQEETKLNVTITSSERSRRKRQKKMMRIRFTTQQKLAKFERLIQHICKDFNIRYIWFDQTCIDQSDHDQRKQEIQRMHKIYKNAYCTLVLLPEFQVQPCIPWHGGSKHVSNMNTILDFEWCKRAWTLEEAYMASRLVFVGRNVHMWSPTKDERAMQLPTPSDKFLYNICTTQAIQWNASSVLWHARRRTSSKAHDRVFALANMFPDIIHRVDFSYKQPLDEAMVQFYGTLAQHDLSILCFGSPLTVSKQRPKDNHITAGMIVRQKEEDRLPTWTGIRGMHIIQSVSDHGFMTTKFEAARRTTVSGRQLCISCQSISIRLSPLTTNSKPSSYEFQGPTWWNRNGLEFDHELPTSVSPAVVVTSGANDYKRAMMFISDGVDDQLKMYAEEYALDATHWLPMTTSKDGLWTNALPDDDKKKADGGTKATNHYCAGCLSLIISHHTPIEQQQEQHIFTEYAILSEIAFSTLNDEVKAMPVVGRRKADGIYEAIGLCFLDILVLEHLDPGVETTREFIIE